MRRQLGWLLGMTLIAGAGVACEKKGDSPLSAIGKMSLAGTVRKAGGSDPIADATVRAIKLLDADAIQQLVEVVKIPDGAGGQKDRLRIKLDKVHAFAPDFETKTDAAGAFKLEVDLQAYLVYIFGPGAEPGKAGSYTVSFWGINPETGELSLDHLIGKNGKLEQQNDAIYLGGGPTPPPVPAPEPPPAPPVVSEEAPPTTPPSEPTEVDPAKPEDVAPTAPDQAFWATDIATTHRDGTLDAATPSAEEIFLPEGQRYLDLQASLGAAQTEPVKLVMQVGFDTAELPDCPDVIAAAKTYVYDVMPNGSLVSYKLVPPGPYFKVFFAKSATKEEGKPVSAENPTATLTVGKRDCSRARPERPFLATLTWDRNEVDLDLHVGSAPWRDFYAQKDLTQMTDAASWMARQGVTLSLDVDNVVGYGPESNGEAASVTDTNSKCYTVQVHAYAGASFPTTATVDVSHVTQKDGVYKVEKYSLSKTLSAVGEWWQVGIFPPDCKQTEPPAAPEEREVATEAGDGCSYPSEFDALDPALNSRFEATGSFDGQAVTMSCEYENATRIVKGNNAQGFDYTPSAASGDAPVSLTASCSTKLGSKNLRAILWLMRVGQETKALSGDTTTTAYPYFQLNVMYDDNSKIFRTPNAYGSLKGTTFTAASASLETLEKQSEKPNKPKRGKGCFTSTWSEDGGGTGSLTGYFDLNYIK